jgi:tetratricopeptide (TPR) repeat protein
MGIDFKDDIQPLFKPLLIATAAFIVGYIIFTWKLDEEDSSGKIVTMIIGGVFFAVGAGFVIWPVGRLMVTAFEAIFWPEDSYKSPANYKLPEWYCQQGRYAEALDEYEKIIENYPHELDGWVGMLNVSVYYMGDVGTGEKIYRRALHALTGEADRQAVQEHYTAIATGAGAHPVMGDASGVESDLDPEPPRIPGDQPDGDPDLPNR